MLKEKRFKHKEETLVKIDEGLWIDGTIIWKGGESLHQAETCVGILIDDSQRTRNRQAPAGACHAPASTSILKV